jgi:hypothetical protein
VHTYMRVLLVTHTWLPQQASATAEGPEPFKTGQLFKLRWLTPTVEVPLCGHATLASAAVLYEGEKTCVRQGMCGTGQLVLSREYLQSLLPARRHCMPVLGWRH